MAQGRGKKINQVKNERAHAEWMLGKKLGRGKQQWVWDFTEGEEYLWSGHWEKV